MPLHRPPLAGLLAALIGLAAAAPCTAQGPYGRESPVPVAPFLDGVFPHQTPGGTGGWTVEDAFPGLTFLDPVAMKAGPATAGGGDRLYVVGKEGQIWFFDNDPGTAAKTLFLDISDRVQVTDNAGLVGLAFHPEFGQPGSPNRRYFYVFYYHHPSPYTVTNNDLPNPAYDRLSRFEVPDGSDLADPDSEFVMVQQWDRHHWHNGGAMFFGDDGFLYVSVGDEGSDFDPYDVGQRLDGALLNGVMRIDVDMDLSRSHPIRRQPAPGGTPPAGFPPSFSQGYTIPDDNPWLDPGGAILEEFWCTGLRSPHTMSYDPATGGIFVGDVGQGSREEIDKITKAANYGWPIREGDIAGPKPSLPTFGGTAITGPIHAYPRSTGVCVIVGPVYRGREHAAALGGKLLFADHEFRKLWCMDPDGDSSSVEFLANMPPGGFHANTASFGVDRGGEVYMVKLAGEGNPDGKLYKLARTGANNPEPPALLSETGAFVDTGSLEPSAKLLPYALNTPFWSDGASKARWAAIPNDGSHDTPAEQVGYSAEGEWSWPEGTVFAKHFELAGRRLETRFLVHGTGGDWYGVTYRWRPDGSDADLLYSGGAEEVPDGAGGTQTWLYPGRGDCMTCHRPVAGFALGPKTRQLNGDLPYPGSGRTANQIATWAHLGVFDNPPAEASLPALLTGAPVDDLRRPVELRARSWLDSNCAYCHRPGGAQPDFDARLSTPLENSNLINGALVGGFGIPGAAVVRAHDPDKSILHLRSQAVGDLGMPPLAKALADPEGVRALRDWINSLDPALYPTAGARGEYFNDRDLSVPALTRTDPAIDFNWGTGSPDPSIGADTFSARWTGFFVPPISGTYTFHVRSNNGVRLWVDGAPVIDRWVSNTVINASGTAELAAGVPAPFTAEYFEDTASAELRLEWEAAGLPREVVGGGALVQSLPPDGPPVAANDLAGEISATTAIDILANDLDFEDNLDPSSVAITGPPARGDAVFDAGLGAVLYTPGGSPGADSFTYTVADSAGHLSNEALVTLTVAGGHYASWLATHFPEGGADADPTADPDRDGHPNAVEYATGSDPLDSGSTPADSLTRLADGSILWTIPRPADREADIGVRASTDLTHWSAPGAGINLIDGGPATLQVTIAPEAAGTPLFLRLEVAVP